MPGFAYDAIEYPGHPRPQTHPDRLAAIARLHGVPAAAPSRCSYLEVGCGDASNLFPLALAYPGSRFVGIDLSGAAVERGERMRVRLGLRNLSLQVADASTWDPGGTRYDYVCAHGFYSWVPAGVRDALLRLCRERLAPGGIAYVSYNALPGCHIRRMVWEMLRHHVRRFEEPSQRLRQAYAMLQFLEHGLIGGDAYVATVRAEIKRLLEDTDPAVLFHDDLGEINEPVSVTDFVAHAQRFGLEFLAEADYSEMTEEAAPPEIAAKLRQMAEADFLAKEQYLDYLKGRRFRQSLLCRSDAPLRRTPDPAVVMALEVAGEVSSATQPMDLAPGARMQFRGVHGSALTVDHPVAKAALLEIGERYPGAQTVAAMLACARERVGRVDPGEAGEDAEALCATLLTGFRLGLVGLTCESPRFAVHAGRRPRASALARAQLEAGSDGVTTLRSGVVRIADPVTRMLLRLLDGTRDREALLQDLAQRLADDPMALPDGQPPLSAGEWRVRLGKELERGLAEALGLALLVDERE
ncbi:class I SAM-dependent methyltransferase [Pseudoxanthomonas suwonensis]|uniref:class I SAM-dependent methyltransferase n=1 Tax=Pseudoxanthomonas suwonensis TaxID=314722 RepID=UPI000A3F24EC|nr:class I SAM-dependent methyltransferase [Pseudoxanthomonas suwonensis]